MSSKPWAHICYSSFHGSFLDESKSTNPKNSSPTSWVVLKRVFNIWVEIRISRNFSATGGVSRFTFQREREKTKDWQLRTFWDRKKLFPVRNAVVFFLWSVNGDVDEQFPSRVLIIMARRHGWELPAHTFQVLAFVVNLLSTFISNNLSKCGFWDDDWFLEMLSFLHTSALKWNSLKFDCKLQLWKSMILVDILFLLWKDIILIEKKTFMLSTSIFQMNKAPFVVLSQLTWYSVQVSVS